MFEKIGIIGLGLIGGSIAKILKGKGYYVATVKSKSPDVAKARKILDKVFPNIQALANGVDLIVIATPLPSILPIAKEITSDHPLLVIDVGSVKEDIVKTFERLTKGKVEFLSTHPMAGTEKTGFDAADEKLFVDASWIIVPHKKNKAKIEKWIEMLGAKPIVMGAKEHDQKTALISHLPHLISKLLWDFVEKKDSESIKIAGPTFRSMTRVAHSPLLAEMLSLNGANIQALFKEWLKYISKR